jgi:Trypsin-co-occurring domain 1
MKRYIEFSLDREGGSIVVEVDEPEGAGTVRAGRGADLPEKAQLTFEEAMGRIRPAAEAIVAKLRDLSDQPDQIGVEFGLKLSGTAGAIVASAAIEANYKVTLTWKHSR